MRIVHFKAGRRWCSADQVLHLFRVVGKDVVRVLTTDAFYEQVGRAAPDKGDVDETPFDPDCSFSYTKRFPPKGKAAVFHMMAGKTQGFYDLQRTQKRSPTVT